MRILQKRDEMSGSLDEMLSWGDLINKRIHKARRYGGNTNKIQDPRSAGFSTRRSYPSRMNASRAS